jgi:hypothetical protein
MMKNGSRLGRLRRGVDPGLALACAITAFLLLGRVALAAQCLTTPVALPGLSGPPVWFDPGAPSPLWRAELNDPRWAGAPIYTLCANLDLSSCAPGTANAQFRVLLDGTTLYLAIQNLVDDATTSSDAVFVGVAQRAPALGARAASIVLGGGSPVTVPAGIPSDAIAPAPAPANVVATFSATTATLPGDWVVEKDALDPVIPAWLPKIGASEGIALWKGSPGVQWAVTLKIDLTQLGYAAPITQPIRLFVGSRHVPSVCPTPGSCAQVPLPNVTTNTVRGSATIIPSNPASWTELVPSAGCSGIEIDPSSIGVWTGASPLSSMIQACPPAPRPPPASPWPPGCPGARNRFRVVPHNVPATSSGPATPHAVRANLRLANWGSTIDSMQHAPWQPIPGTGNPLSDPVLGPAWQWIGSASGSPTIELECPLLPGATYCPAIGNAGLGPGQSPHQCLLAELKAQPGLNLPFVSSAAYRNMIFANLSSTSTDATLTIQGLQKLTGTAAPRDLYLYVQTRNMPAHSDTARELPAALMEALLGYAENPPARPIARRRGNAGPVGVAAPSAAVEKFDPVSLADLTSGTITDIRQLPPARNPLLWPTLTGDQALGLAWPSYRVYVYYDTGERQRVDGVERASLAPMVPFGYYLKHAGTFFGFEHELRGQGVQLEPLGGSWYRVRVENEGSVVVGTRISAEEKPRRESPCSGNCPPPGRVEPRPICFCSAPGLGGPSASGGLGLALLTLLAAARSGRSRRRG